MSAVNVLMVLRSGITVFLVLGEMNAWLNVGASVM